MIYVNKNGDPQIPLGDYLGQMTDELEGKYIEEYVSGGPKNYAYCLNDGMESCKVRGFTLNHTNSQLINFDAVKELVTGPDPSRSISLVNPSKITRDKQKRLLFNRPEIKQYKMVYTKRVIIDDYNTVPYGF